RIGPALLHVVQEDPDLARVVDAAREVVRRLPRVGQMAGVRAGDVRHLVLADVRPQGLGVRRAVSEHEQHLVVLDELLVPGHLARRRTRPAGGPPPRGTSRRYQHGHSVQLLLTPTQRRARPCGSYIRKIMSARPNTTPRLGARSPNACG